MTAQPDTQLAVPASAAVRSEKYRLAEALLAQYLAREGAEVVSLADWILTLRANGRSDRDISDRLEAATDVYASHETIRTWFPHEASASA